MSDVPDLDALAQRLAALADELELALGDAVEVDRQEKFAGAVFLQPSRPNALGVMWIDFGHDDLQVETAGGLGGRWELGRAESDVALIEEIVRAVVAGRVVEVRVANRSRVTVTKSNGSTVTETGSDGLSGCLPIPFWPRWGRKIKYLPYID